jgi:prophage antirepressor-like protein
LKAFSLLGENHIINIQGTLENPLFQASQIGKLLGIKNINQNITDFDNEEKGLCTAYTLGGEQEAIFLTEIGLYKLLGRSRKTIAATFQKWMINILREIRINGMYKLNETKEVDKKLMKHNCAVITHNTLMKAFDKKSIIYICKVKEVDDKIVIKIGSTQNVKERMHNLSSNQNSIEPLLLDIYESQEHTKFERFLHKHIFIAKYYYPMSIKNGEVSNETYLVNNEQYKEFIKIINESKVNFQTNSIEYELAKTHTEEARAICENIILRQKELEVEQTKIKLRQQELNLEQEKIKLLQQELELEFKKIDCAHQSIQPQEISQESTSPLVDVTTCNFVIKKRINGITVPKVYQYIPTNLITPIKIFDSPVEVEREFSDISPGPLRLSAKNNTIYKGFRWVFVNRTMGVPINVLPTVIKRHKSPDIDFIAMIDIKKTKIMAVYSNQKEATQARNMKCNSFNRAINQGSISSGHYWNYFDKCSDEMKTDFLSHSQLPEKYVSSSGKRVQQIDPKTGHILKTYATNREVSKLFQIGIITLKRVMEAGEIAKGYKWKLE